MPVWKAWRHKTRDGSSMSSAGDPEKAVPARSKWSLGILSDKETDEVPGSILLLSKESDHNEPLGLRNAPARTSASSLPSPYPPSMRSVLRPPEKKRTADGKIILDPQPDESLNDPLNWSAKRRDAALVSIGFYCMVGGGMTPILAAGFHDVAETYHVSEPSVALTTGLYMMGLGLGSVIFSPAAILFGKRPVYLATAILFILSSVWCALSLNYVSLLIARIVQGLAVSPVECLPSASVAEIFFLHERAYRLGIYTLLLLGGKNLVPLVSAVIIQALGWRWVFWIFAMVVGFGLVLLFLFVPETFWDRTPRPHGYYKKHPGGQSSVVSPGRDRRDPLNDTVAKVDGAGEHEKNSEFPLSLPSAPGSLAHRRRERHAHFSNVSDGAAAEENTGAIYRTTSDSGQPYSGPKRTPQSNKTASAGIASPEALHSDAWRVVPMGGAPKTPLLHNLNSPYYATKTEEEDYFALEAVASSNPTDVPALDQPKRQSSLQWSPEAINKPPASPLRSALRSPDRETPQKRVTLPTTTASGPPTTDLSAQPPPPPPRTIAYTDYYKSAPPKTYLETLAPYSGRLSHDSWFRVLIRPFILFAYPSILWSTLIYSLSVGWLIVLSESVSSIYRDRDSYNFSALQTGLVYLSPFVGGVLGTAVAGKVSDLIVRWMSRRNGGIYEPEFRLVMAIPVAVSTTIGLMGFGWSAEERDAWIVPTIFFGVISFGCSLGSTTAITFAVDSYRQYAGEALVTLNFSKNIFHGLVFSLFFTHWLESEGAKDVFVAIGGIQMACLLFTIPVYIYGKRARMWTVRKNLMEKF